MTSRSLHVITSLLELLFPGHGFILSVHPKAGHFGTSSIITNLQDADVIAMMQEYLMKHKEGTVHVNDRKPLKN